MAPETMGPRTEAGPAARSGSRSKARPLEMRAMRAWALRTLAGATRATGGAKAAKTDAADAAKADAADANEFVAPALVQDAQRTSWDMFLGVERCALPLRRRLAELSSTGEDPLSPGGESAVDASAVQESRRALSVRANLEILAGLARERDWRLVVLKTSVVIASDATVLDGGDVDVLAPAGAERDVARALGDRGYDRYRRDSEQHLAARVTPGAAAIEVHHGIHSFDSLAGPRARIRPLEAVPGLWRLHPADHLWHVLHHAVVQHPERRGAIRDLVTLGFALEDASPADVDEVEERARAHEDAGPLGRMLEMARSLRRHHRTDDAFADARFSTYALAARFGVFGASSDMGRAVVKGAERKLFGAASSPLEALSLDVSTALAGPYWFGPVEWLRRRWMPGAQLALRLVRAIRIGISAAVAAVARLDAARLRWTSR